MGRFVAPTQRSMLVRRDGSKVSIDDTHAPIRDAQGTLVGAVMVFRDVEARRTAAAQREADKRKDEFLATLAHELRNPLAPIDQAALILESATATDEQRRWSSEVIRRQVRNMSVLLDDLLDVARITHGTLMLRAEPTLLSDIVDAAIETARPSIDASRHDLTIDLPNESPVLDVDGLRLAQVLSNLLINAARYTSPGGRLSVSAHCSDDSISVTVSDTGIGFTSRDRTRMFERFSKVDPGRTRSSGGLGIGLALAKGLVELHGGQIDAKSAGPGCGSEFTLRLPASLRRPRIETPSVSQHADRAVRWRVVVADDNVDAATSLAALLEMDGHDVTVVHDGERAVEVVQSARPDVALLDIGMPKLDGYEVAERIRGGELGTQVTLVAITGWGQQNDRAHALAAGFDHHFTKPVQHERLRDILQARGPARPRLSKKR
jgi:signal transduction histidine kinase/CheY-like chemotaxis protein